MDDQTQKQDHLDELISEGKWKPALKLIENRQKKGDKSDVLQVKKIIIWLKSTDNARSEQGEKQLNELIHRKPPITDIAALKALDIFLSKHGEQDGLINQLWERAADVQNKDENFLSAWFLVNLEQERWPAAQKAAMIWQKSFSQKRTPFYLYILCSYLVSITPGLPERDKMLSQMLSFKFLSKAAQEVPSASLGPDPPSPPRAVNTEEDLFLLLRVYKAQKKYIEALAILEDPRTGFQSRYAKNSWAVLRQMIEFYRLCERWHTLWKTCQNVLEYVQPSVFKPSIDGLPVFNFGDLGDDWLVWDGFVTAAANVIEQAALSETRSLVEGVDEFIGRFCEHQSSRNAALASIKFHASSELIAAHNNLREAGCEFPELKLLALTCQYFKQRCTKVSCFQDLQPFLAALSVPDQERFLVESVKAAEEVRPFDEANEAQKMAWMTAEVNALKFEYHLVVSRDENLGLTNILPSFVASCLRLYSLSPSFTFELPPSDRLPEDDAAILAAMALVRMSKLAYKHPEFSNSLFRAVVVLEIALSRSKHNYDILLILVRIYMALGLGSLAIRRYHQLSIKNLQHVTLSWVLYSRISTIHPHPARVDIDGKGMTTIDPLVHMISILRWHEEALELNLHSILQLQKTNSWTMQLDALGTKSVLQNGFARPLLLAECARIKRLRFPDGNQQTNAKDVQLPETVKDTRDRTAFPNYNADGQLTFEEELPSPAAPAIEPNAKWLAANLSQAQLWGILSGNDFSTFNRKSLVALIESSDLEDDASCDDERTVFTYCNSMKSAVQQMHHSTETESWSSDANHSVCESLDDIKQHLDDMAQESASEWARIARSERQFVHPSWAMFNTIYMRLELCQFIQKASVFALDREKRASTALPLQVKTKLQELSASCKSLASAIWLDATNFRADCFDPEYLEGMVSWVGSEDDVVGRQLGRLAKDRVDTESVCKMLQQSWVEAWDGVLKTNIL